VKSTGICSSLYNSFNAPKEVARLKGHTAGISYSNFDSTGKYILTIGADNTVRKWDVTTTKLLSVLTIPGEMPIAASPDGKYVITKEGSIFDFDTQQKINSMTGGIQLDGYSFDREGKRVAGYGQGGYGKEITIRVWDVATGQRIALLRGHTKTIRDISFSADGQLLASGSEDGTIRIWDIQSQQQLQAFAGKDAAEKEHLHSVWSVEFSEDGKYLLTAGSNNEAWIWDSKTWTHDKRLNPGRSVSLREAHFSKDGRWVIMMVR
jgi:WD40 repeat protein